MYTSTAKDRIMKFICEQEQANRVVSMGQFVIGTVHTVMLNVSSLILQTDIWLDKMFHWLFWQ